MKSIKTIEICAITPNQMKAVKGGTWNIGPGDTIGSPGSRPSRPTVYSTWN